MLEAALMSLATDHLRARHPIAITIKLEVLARGKDRTETSNRTIGDVMDPMEATITIIVAVSIATMAMAALHPKAMR